MKAKKIVSRCLIWLGVGSILLPFALGVLAYMVKSVDAPDGGFQYDGLGRKLSKVPTLLRFLFVGEEKWAGVGWFCIDLVSFVGLLFLGKYLFSLGCKETPSDKDVANGKEQT